MPAVVTPALSIYRGDTFVKTLQIATKNDDGVTFDGVDLTAYGSVWEAQLRKSEDDETALTFEVDTTQAENGFLTLRLESDQTLLIPTKGVWDIQVTDTNQTPHYVRTLCKGTFVREKDVSR